MKFKHLELGPDLLRAVEDAGYQVPSPIQEKAIPPVLEGRDLLGCAQTGTGKTAAFALPILQRLAAAPGAKRPEIRALVLTPTRELALQIQESFLAYGKYLPLRSAVIFGGVGQNPQVAALKRGVDILVATPGRLLDLMQQGFVKLGHLEIFVLDEADRMLDMGFVHDVKRVIKEIPKKRQTLLFSATMPKEISDLADKLLHHPVKVAVTPVSSTVDSIQQSLYKVDKNNKRLLLAHLLKTQGAKSALVFTRTKHGADRVVKDLAKAGIPAVAIHGNKSQNARQDALAKLKDGRVQVMVATDIAARGLDINELSHVFNYDLPNIPETYVHRIGRTGRAGRGGVAVSFCMEEELPYLADIEKLIGFSVPEVTGHAWPMQGGGQPKAAVQPPVKREKKPVPQEKKLGKPGKKNIENPEKAPKQPNKQPEPAKKAFPPSGAPQAGANKKGRGRPGGMPKPILALPGEFGGQNIVTRRPVWGGASSAAPVQGPSPDEGDDMSKGRRRTGKNRGKQNKPETPAAQPPKRASAEIPKDKNGIFQFSDEDLAQDDSIRLIRPTASGETKFASFEDYLKGQD